MKETDLKTWLGHAARNKDAFMLLLDSQNANALENGKFFIDETFFNDGLRSFATEKTSGILKEYKVVFDENQIIVKASVYIPQLNYIDFMYLFEIERFSFDQNIHRILLNYKEKATPRGNALQTIAFNSLSRDGSYLKGISELLKKHYIKAGRNQVLLDLDETSLAASIPPPLTLKYKGAHDGKLEFSFSWNE